MKTDDEPPDYDFSNGVRGKYAGRYRERPSIRHTITTAFGLMYLLIFACSWLSVLAKPGISEMPGFWPESIFFGLVLTAAALFLSRELIRQFRLYRQWNAK